jgi:MinD-like ATPase involved in chromosome partitioning or flagellar assembly
VLSGSTSPSGPSATLSGTEIQVQLYSNDFKLQALVAAQHMHDYQLEEHEFHQILGALHNQYMVNLIDMGPDRRVPTFWPALSVAHAIVLVTTPNADAIDKTKLFIDLVRDSCYAHLLTRTVLLWNNATPGGEVVINVEATKSVLVRELSPQNDPSTCLVDIPMDPHLAAGGEINLQLLRKDTRRQFERAAALLMDKLPDRTTRPQRPGTEHKGV